MDISGSSIEGVLTERFKISRAPTLVGRVCAGAGASVAFTRLRSSTPPRGRSMSVPTEDSFAFQVPLTLPFYSGIWISGKRLQHSSISIGDVFLFDLSTNPTVGLEAQFDSVRLYMPKGALDAMSREGGLPLVGGLKAHQFGDRDPVLHGLAQALAGVLNGFDGGGALFGDYISLAFHSHVVHVYGTGLLPNRGQQGGLSPWQLRRVRDLIEARLAEEPSMVQLAAECNLSPRYFARAFKKSTGMPPHHWLIMRRLARARDLLEVTDMPLAEIATACGFCDQSHFTRIFTRYEGSSPGRWRHYGQPPQHGGKVPGSTTTH
jgi:AraC family transcriptional regulator